MDWDLRLDEKCACLRVEPGRKKDLGDFNARLGEFSGLPGGRYCMQVGDAEEALVPMLEIEPVPDSPQIIADVDRPRRGYTGKDPFHMRTPR